MAANFLAAAARWSALTRNDPNFFLAQSIRCSLGSRVLGVLGFERLLFWQFRAESQAKRLPDLPYKAVGYPQIWERVGSKGFSQPFATADIRRAQQETHDMAIEVHNCFKTPKP